jgi:DNA excision repair protein ERCC-3
MTSWFVLEDGTVWVPAAEVAEPHDTLSLSAFAEPFSRQEDILRYRIQPVSLWQAAENGHSAREVLTWLRHKAGRPIPLRVQEMIVREMGKWGKLVLQAEGQELRLTGDAAALRHARRVLRDAAGHTFQRLCFPAARRAWVKQTLARHGWPVLDKAGIQAGPPVAVGWRDGAALRPYQRDAVDAFLARSGGGVVVLPCGAGKTWVGLGALVALRQTALIIAPNDISARQWLDALRRFTTAGPEDVGMYAPNRPLFPITITTYPRVSAKTRNSVHVHLDRLAQAAWGLVIYDEVQMLPAPLFRLAAELQGLRRLGLTATLVREDGAETDVFSLIGGKCFDLPWRTLERWGYLSQVRCVEIRVPLPPEQQAAYESAPPRERHRIAATNPRKIELASEIAARHRGQGVLVLGHYLDGLRGLAQQTGWPLVCGDTPDEERSRLFQRFRDGEIPVLVLSRVANVAVDLPNASVGIQLSGLFGSRQEEAQRVGRLLRPKNGFAVFYTLVSAGTVEQTQAHRRQMFLCDQGYEYEIQDVDVPHIEEVSG